MPTTLLPRHEIYKTLETERATSLAFWLMAGRDSHGSSIVDATLKLQTELNKAVSFEFSTYGRALRKSRRIVLIASDGSRCAFGAVQGQPIDERPSWSQVALAARRGLTLIAQWAAWRQRSLDILGAPDLAARRLIATSNPAKPVDVNIAGFRHSVARFFDTEADMAIAHRALEALHGPVAPDATTKVVDLTEDISLVDVADATLSHGLAASNVDSLEEKEKKHMAETTENSPAERVCPLLAAPEAAAV